MQMARRIFDSLKFWWLILKGECEMLDMYVALVIAGRRTCNTNNRAVKQVPANYREAVLADLEALGLDADGKEII